MERITLLTEEREGKDTIQKHLGGQHRNNIIPPNKTKLKVNNIYLSEVIDKFGNEVSVSPAGYTFFIATINEEPTPELFMWTREFCPPIEIIFPENAETELKQYFSRLIKDDDSDIKPIKEYFEATEEFLSST